MSHLEKSSVRSLLKQKNVLFSSSVEYSYDRVPVFTYSRDRLRYNATHDLGHLKEIEGFLVHL